MPQPYDYSQLVGGFRSPQEAFVDAIKLNKLYEQEQKAKTDAQNLKTDLASLQANPTPQAFAEFYLKYPSMKDQVEAYRKTLTEADNRFIVDTAQEAFLLNRAGQTDAVLNLFDQRIEALKNSGRKDMIESAQRAKRLYEIAPDQKTREGALGMILYNYGGGDNYEKVWGASDEKSTAFQQDFDFIKKTFGDAAAAEYAQYGRSGIVSIPLGDGRTYVGPPSMAPGATRWQQQQGTEQTPTEQKPVTQQGAASILGGASRSKKITQEEANVILQSLGPNGQTKFNQWLTDNSIKIIVRTGTAPDGRRVVQFQDGTVEYGAD